MTDDLSQKGKLEEARINIHLESELNYWAERFHVTPARLKQAVEKVGPVAKDVQDELARN